MYSQLTAPAHVTLAGLDMVVIFVVLSAISISFFTYLMVVRLTPLFRAAPAHRLNNYPERLKNVLIFWLGQKRHPRYFLTGIIHILIFSGFIILSLHSMTLAINGIVPNFVMPGLSGITGQIYSMIKDYAATFVLIACIAAAVRRLFFMEDRYRVPEKYGKEHTGEALLVLSMISCLMISDALYEAAVYASQTSHSTPPLTLVWVLTLIFKGLSVNALQAIHTIGFTIHELTFFSFLCVLPLGKHFHVITSIFNVFLKRIETGNIKPVLFGVKDEDLAELESFGVKKIEDFTWKDMLDFYSCVDCGRCSDNCPAVSTKSPLSPRFISIKARKLMYGNYPIFGKKKESIPLMGDIYEDGEIWACTTCGACEQECPVCIEYIDKIVGLRRGLVDDGEVPQGLQKPFESLAKRGNPFGKLEKKRSDWAKVESFAPNCPVKSIDAGDNFETLFFVDSIGCYDDRIQDIIRDAAMLLNIANEDFGVLGKEERDSGNEVRRFGEEMLFQDLKAHNTGIILESGVSGIITTDPHAYNALIHDYDGIPGVRHISVFLWEAIQAGRIRLKTIESPDRIYTYHDPCYLGRHNNLYEEPRNVIDAIPGIQRVEMNRSRDRSFCCGGGGMMLFYEPEAEMRVGAIRVQMAVDAGAHVIVTACPFCMVNLVDAVKVAGLEKKMQVIDLCELIYRHIEQ